MNANAVAAHWGQPVEEPRLIQVRENTVYAVSFADRGDAALRLHRLGYQSESAILAELIWMEALATHGFPCPRPWQTPSGARVVDVEGGGFATLISWVPGEPIGAFGKPPFMDLDPQIRLYRRIGGVIADLHETTDRLQLDDLDRHAWDAPGLVGADPFWGRYWENPTLTAQEKDLVQEARKAAGDHLAALPSPDFGLIHADLLQENILAAGDTISIIDFDDGGYGYRGYDLASALIQHVDGDRLGALLGALREGYAKRRVVEPLELQLFMLLRSMASAGWVISRIEPTSPAMRFYAERVVRLSTAYLKTV